MYITSIIMEKLISNLKKAGWTGRQEKYGAVFKEARFNNVVESPLASVIIISWRFVEDLKKNLLLLTEQRSVKYEVIFVNNGKEETEFASILPYVDTYVALNHNTGAYIARNIGSLFATAPILIFLEDDGVIGSNFVRAHLDAYDKYAVISVRGMCKPLTNNPLNKLARHYDLGKKAYPAAANLEGNSSYNAEAFFQVGGWNDDIYFGHGGPELSYRLTKKFPDQRMQIYYPEPLIHHDYARNEEHLKNKKEQQNASYEMLKLKYHDWEDFLTSWLKFRRRRYTIHKKQPSFSETLSDGVDYLLYDIARPVYRFLFRRRQ